MAREGQAGQKSRSVAVVYIEVPNYYTYTIQPVDAIPYVYNCTHT